MGHKLPDEFLVFDVESVGLHGEGYAVGWCLVDRAGNRLAEGCHACDPINASGEKSGREWLAANATVPQSGYDLPSPDAVRESFWRSWLSAKDRGAVLIADCAWPVEARFLIHCVQRDDSREWAGPYPLHDLASIRLAAGLDPLGTEERLPDELPVHDPLCDARQSARLLIEALDLLEAQRS